MPTPEATPVAMAAIKPPDDPLPPLGAGAPEFDPSQAVKTQHNNISLINFIKCLNKFNCSF